MIKQTKRRKGRKALKLDKMHEERIKLVPISPLNAMKENIDNQLHHTTRLHSVCTLPKIHISSHAQIVKIKEPEVSALKEKVRNLQETNKADRIMTELRDELPIVSPVSATTGLLENFISTRFKKPDEIMTQRYNSPKKMNLFERPKVGQAFKSKLSNNSQETTNFWGLVSKNVSSIKKKDESDWTEPSITLSGFDS